MSATPPEPISALFLILTEIEEFARPYRLLHTTDGAAGLPAHITLLYPFRPCSRRDEEAHNKLKRIAASLRTFTLDLSRLERFPAHRILFLEPEPIEPIIALIRAVMEGFPGVEPYGGGVALEDLRPHSTLAVCANDEQMETLDLSIRNRLETSTPLRATVRAIHVATLTNGQWQVQDSCFPLGEEQ